MFKKKNKPKPTEKFIDIEAGMEGTLKFDSPVNLKISGKFEGELETKGVLRIGEKADVKTKVIKGEDMVIAGKVKGNIVSSERLELSATAKVEGNIIAPILVINEGAMLKGNCRVSVEPEKTEHKKPPKKKK